MKRNILIITILLAFVLSAKNTLLAQNDSNLWKNNIFINKKYFFMIGLEGRLMARLNDYTAEVKSSGVTTPWGYNIDSIMPLKNTLTPFLNFNINRFFKRYLFSIGSKIGKIAYGKIKIYDWNEGSTKIIQAGEYVFNVNSSIGYRMNLRKCFVYSKINMEYKLLNLWINEYAAYVHYYKGFSTFFNPVYVTSELMLGIPLRSGHLIIPKIELFVMNISKQLKFFEYKGGNYYFINLGISYGI